MCRFSALQRAEIAEITYKKTTRQVAKSFSALQRAEIAEIFLRYHIPTLRESGFSALQRAEIAEIVVVELVIRGRAMVSVLFNEPKLLKYTTKSASAHIGFICFSALQRAEIAEIITLLSSHNFRRESFSALQRAEIAEM